MVVQQPEYPQMKFITLMEHTLKANSDLYQGNPI